MKGIYQQGRTLQEAADRHIWLRGIGKIYGLAASRFTKGCSDKERYWLANLYLKLNADIHDDNCYAVLSISKIIFFNFFLFQVRVTAACRLKSRHFRFIPTNFNCSGHHLKMTFRDLE